MGIFVDTCNAVFWVETYHWRISTVTTNTNP